MEFAVREDGFICNALMVPTHTKWGYGSGRNRPVQPGDQHKAGTCPDSRSTWNLWSSRSARRRYYLSLASHSSAILGLHSFRKMTLSQPSLTSPSRRLGGPHCDFAMVLLLNDGELGQTA